MTFFNKKEEVIEIKLTQYGKTLLSKGRWRPTYYAFFDDDILYDIQYSAQGWVPRDSPEPVSEAQNATEGRIQDDTPNLRVQHIYTGAETQVSKRTFTAAIPVGDDEVDPGAIQRTALTPHTINYQKPLPPPTAEKAYILGAPLGTSELNSEYLPSWAINFLAGELSSSVSYSTGSHPNFRIPQLNADIEYELEYDGTSVNMGGTKERIILEVLENNSLFTNENFDIEVFEVEDITGGQTTPGITRTDLHEELTPLSFAKKTSLVQNNLLLDPGEIQNIEHEADNTSVEYYMEISIDSEIPKETIRALHPGRKPKSVFTKE